jgi:FtsP/CotA-like multicopper oxidase with cupredoxin domain
VRPEGLEPPAYWFEASRSIQLSYGRAQAQNHNTYGNSRSLRKIPQRAEKFPAPRAPFYNKKPDASPERSGRPLAHPWVTYSLIMQQHRLSLSLLFCFVLGLSSIATSRAESVQPPDWDANVKLPEARDTSADPRIVEIALEAAVSSLEIVPGVKSDVWTYNGGLPGPLIRAHVGDRVIVHFTNKLPKPTTVHWHGVRVPIEMDGVPGISQPEVPPGGTFTYDFVVPDAGLFWYHPHVMSAAQVGFGLYGALLVEDPTDSVGVADQLVLVLSDIGIDDKTGALHSADSGGGLGTLFGREGNIVLVNGRVNPTLKIREGGLQRWRIVNTAKSRYFNLVLGESQRFVVIGADGGQVEYSTEHDQLVLAPGERLDVLLAPRRESAEALILRTFPFDRGFGSIEFRTVEDLLTLVPASMPAIPPAPLPRFQHALTPMSTSGATHLRMELLVDRPSATFSIKTDPDYKHAVIPAALGETQVWTITNHATWAHPIHIHGFFFQVLDENGAPVHPIAWKDTVSVPADSSLRLAVRFDRPGSWMYHCHILDHAEAGLMSTVDVGLPASGESGHHH